MSETEPVVLPSSPKNRDDDWEGGEPPPPSPREAAAQLLDDAESGIERTERTRERQVEKHVPIQATYQEFDEDFSDDEDVKNFAALAGRADSVGGLTANDFDFEPPSKEKIQKYIVRRHLRSSTGKKFSVLCTEVGYPVFRKTKPPKKGSGEAAVRLLGPGISSYFYFLRCYTLVFLLFTVITIPSMFFNAVIGSALNDKKIPQLSVGNLFVAEDLFGGDDVDNFYTFSYEGRELNITRDTVAYVHIVADIVIIILFLIFAEHSIMLFKRMEYQWEVAHPKIEHFSVEVTHLPKTSNYKEIKEHFARLVNHTVAPKLNGMTIDRRSFRKQKRRQSELDFDQNVIEDVQVVTTTRDKLTFAIRMANLSRTAEHMAAKLAVAQKRRANKKMSEARFRAIVRDHDKAVARLKAYYEKEIEHRGNLETQRTIKAFVTFANVKDRNGVLEEYEKARKGTGLCTKTDPKLLIGGKKPIVKPATAPALMTWEHMEYKSSSRRGRACFSFLAIGIVLLIAAVCNFVVSKVENFELFSVLSEEQKDLVNGDNLNCEVDFPAAVIESTLASAECEPFTLVEANTPDICVQAFSCQCEDTTDPNTLTIPVCRQLLLDDLVNSAFLVGTGLVVIVFNVILEILIEWTVVFEKDEDRAKGEKKLYLRLFIASYINTAIVKLFVDFNLKKLINVDVPFFEDGELTDFSFDWYAQAGLDVAVIGIINIPGPHLLTLSNYVYCKLKNCCFKPMSMRDVERHYLGPRFLLPLRYAQAMVTIYFTFTYSAGVPFLYPLCAASLYLTFWVDKFILLRFSRTPPLYTNDIVIGICRGMKQWIIVHAVFALLMLSEPGLFPSKGSGISLVQEAVDNSGVDVTVPNATVFGNEFFQRATGLPAVFLFLVLILLVLYQILAQFDVILGLLSLGCCKALKGFWKCCCFLICCGKGDNHQERTMLKSYEELQQIEQERIKARLDRNRLVGIKSYNILANPLYEKKFKLKDGKSFSALMQDHEIHSTAEVVHLLDRGESRNEARFVFESATSMREGMGGLRGLFTRKKKDKAASEAGESEKPAGMEELI